MGGGEINTQVLVLGLPVGAPASAAPTGTPGGWPGDPSVASSPGSETGKTTCTGEGVACGWHPAHLLGLP